MERRHAILPRWSMTRWVDASTAALTACLAPTEIGLDRFGLYTHYSRRLQHFVARDPEHEAPERQVSWIGGVDAHLAVEPRI